MTTTSTPSGDHAIWWLVCVCHSKRVPTGIGKVPTIVVGAGWLFSDTNWQRTPFRKQARLARVAFRERAPHAHARVGGVRGVGGPRARHRRAGSRERDGDRP